MKKAEQYVTVSEFIELTGLHRNTVYKWIRRGLLPAKRLYSTGRYYISYLDVPAFIRKGVKKNDRSKK